MVISVKKSGRSFVPRNRGPQRHWAHSGWSLCPACRCTASEHIPLQRPPPWVTLRRTPRAPRQGPGFTVLTSPGPPCGRVSGLDSQALQDPVFCSCSTMVTAVGRSFLRCCRLPSRGCRDTQGTRRELWATLWKLPKGVGSPAEPNSSAGSGCFAVLGLLGLRPR